MLKNSVKIKIFYGLILLILLPMTGLVHLAAGKLYLNFNRYRELESFTSTVKSNLAIIHLIKELQIERGISHIFLGKPDKKFRQELETQYHNTDRAVMQSEKMKKPLFEKLNKIAQLGEIRNKILALDLEQEEVFNFYTKLIEELIDYEYSVLKKINEHYIFSKFYCLILIEELKEKMGQERAIVGFILFRGKITEPLKEKLKELKYMRNHIEKTFILLSSNNEKELYEEIKKATELDTEIEKIINNSDYELSSENWWIRATERIEKHDYLHDIIELEINKRIETLKVQSKNALIISIFQLGLSIFFTLLFVVKFRRFIEKHIFFDPLTGLPNRKFFIEYSQFLINRANRYSEPLSLLMIDIDNFKKINDSLGHSTGDRILIELAKTMKKNIRKSDFPARIGGEEFVVIFPNTDIENAFRVADRIRESFESLNIKTGKGVVKTTLSGGLIAFRKDMTVDDLLKLADLALYNAKNKGKNRIEKYE